MDFHTVVGGVMSADGKIKINESTKERGGRGFADAPTSPTPRSSLCLVAAERLDRLEEAMRDPFGRRSWAGSRVRLRFRLFRDSSTRRNRGCPHGRFPGRRAARKIPRLIRAVVEVDPTEAATERGLLHRRQDVPVSFVYRLYDTRLVREFSIDHASLPNPNDSSIEDRGMIHVFVLP